MTDNVATLAGFTKEIVMDNGEYTLYLLIRPETDIGDRFKAWDMDEQEFIFVNGWLGEVVESWDWSER